MELFARSIPYPTATEFPRTLGVARPDDAGSLRDWLGWMAHTVWPTAPEHPPWAVESQWVARWPFEQCHIALMHRPDQEPVHLMNPFNDSHRNGSESPGDQAAHFLRATGYLMTLAATAHGVSRVLPPGPDDGWDDYSHPLMGFSLNGVGVELDSWQQLRDGDTAALWLWSLADRTEVRSDRDHQARRTKQRGEDQLVPALNTAQAIHDALALLLPQIPEEPEEPTSTPPQRKARLWR